MQITLMIPDSSSGNIATPKDGSPIKRNYSPVPRITSIASPRATSPEIERKHSLLREAALNSFSPKNSPVRERAASEGFVLTQVREIERRVTPPKIDSPKPASPKSDSTPRQIFVGISKLPSTEKKGRMLIAAEPVPPPIPRKDSVVMPPESPKLDPLPPLPTETSPKSHSTNGVQLAMEAGLQTTPLLESKSKLNRMSSERILVDAPRRQLDRGDSTSLRDIRSKINHSSFTGSIIPRGFTNNRCLFEPFILSLSERLCERNHEDVFIRKRDYVLVTNSDNKFIWVKAENESHLPYIKKGSKSTLNRILKKLKSASRNIQRGSEAESDILKNVDRLLENKTVQKHYDQTEKIRTRITELFFKICYGKMYDDTKLIKDMLKLSEYNIMLMCDFLADDQEAKIKKYQLIYPTPPRDPSIVDAIIEDLNHSELRHEMTSQEKIGHLVHLYENPRAVAISTPRVIEYSIENIITQTYNACGDFRDNLKFINDLNAFIENMPEERRQGSLLSVTLPKNQARGLYNDYQVGACISVIMTPYSLALNNMIDVMPHAIRDIYRRTVKLLENQKKIKEIDVAKYLDVIRFQTKVINDQTVQWKLLTGTINEIARYVPKKNITLPKRSKTRTK